MTTMQQRPRDGFASLENLAAALAVDFSDSSELRTSTVSSLSNFDDEDDIAQHSHERKTSRFMEATFRQSTGSKDDMAMPTHKHHRKSLLESHSNKDTESKTKGKNRNNDDKSRQNQKTSSKSKERRKLYSADDSNVGNFAAGLLPKLRPRAANDRQQKSKGKQKKEEGRLSGSNNTLSTTKSDLSQSLVTKLGKSPLESHNRNKAVSRRRASVQAPSVSSHQSSKQSADSKEKPRPRRGQSVDAIDRKNRRKTAEEEKTESKKDSESSTVEEQKKVKTEIHIKFKRGGAAGERHELPSDLCKPRSHSPKKSDNNHSQKKHHHHQDGRSHHHDADDSSKRRQTVDTTTKSGSRRHVEDESGKKRPTATAGDESSRRQNESSRRHGHDESSRRHDESRRHGDSSRRRQTTANDESSKRHHGDESSRRHGDDKKGESSRRNHHSRRESTEKRKQSKDHHDSNHRDHSSRDKRGRDGNSRGGKEDEHGRRHRSHSVPQRSSEHKRTRDSHSHSPKGESRRHKDGHSQAAEKEDRRRGDSHRPRDEHKRNKSRSSAERSRRHRDGDSHSPPPLQKGDENDHAEATEPTSQRRRTRGSMILPATSAHNPETQNQEKPAEKRVPAENNPTNESQSQEKSEEKVPAEKTTQRTTRGSIMVIQTPEDAGAAHEKPRHRRRDDLHGRNGRPVEDRNHHPMEGVGRTERRKPGKKRLKLKRFRSKSTSDLLSKTSSRHQERSGKAGKSKAVLPRPKKINGRSSTTGHLPPEAPSSGSRKNKIASGKQGENSSRGRRHSVGSSGTKEKASSRGRRPASSSVSPPRGRSGLPAPNDQTAHKLTLDTGRRRSISPKRNREKLTKENISRSRFRESLMKQESEQQWEELVAPRPPIRRHSSLSKLETRSRNSLLMHHSHESPSQEEGQHLLLSRSRMGFLDASIPFSDSEDEGEKRSVHQERLVRSIHNHMYSTSESSDDESHLSIPEFDVTDEGPNDVSLEPPSFHQHPSMAGNLNRVDLTALSGSQVQVVLARALNEDS